MPTVPVHEQIIPCRDCGKPDGRYSERCWECWQPIREHIHALLGSRIAFVLQRAGYYNLDDIAVLTDEQLLAIRNFGARSLRTLRSVLPTPPLP